MKFPPMPKLESAWASFRPWRRPFDPAYQVVPDPLKISGGVLPFGAFLRCMTRQNNPYNSIHLLAVFFPSFGHAVGGGLRKAFGVAAAGLFGNAIAPAADATDARLETLCFALSVLRLRSSMRAKRPRLSVSLGADL